MLFRSEAEWYKVKDQIRFDWQQDSYFEELKMNEILTARINLATMMEPFVGKYFSNQYVQREILKLTDVDMSNIQADMADESSEASTFDREADQTLRDTDTRDNNVSLNPSADDSRGAPPARKTSETD